MLCYKFTTVCPPLLWALSQRPVRHLSEDPLRWFSLLCPPRQDGSPSSAQDLSTAYYLPACHDPDPEPRP